MQRPRIVLLCSANRKHTEPAPAIELYRSEFFRLGRSYALSLEPEQVFVMSAVHGLVSAKTVLPPYPMTMSILGKEDVNPWAEWIANSLRAQVSLDRYEIIVLGLRKFAAPVAKRLPGAQTPLVGMNLPQALTYLREQVGNK